MIPIYSNECEVKTENYKKEEILNIVAAKNIRNFCKNHTNFIFNKIWIDWLCKQLEFDVADINKVHIVHLDGKKLVGLQEIIRMFKTNFKCNLILILLV